MTWKAYRYTLRRRKRKSNTQELAGRLAPLEELQGADLPRPAGDNGGPTSAVDDTIRVDSASIKVSPKIVEQERAGADVFRLDPAVAVILVGLLAFIAFIAWQIALMPDK